MVLHGGPGSGCTLEHRRYFDPAAYRIVLFDQRGAGRSEPHASDPRVDLSANTTQHLIADIELLRDHLGVDRWLVWGYSWGSTLAISYSSAHPERITEVVLGSVTMSRPAEIEWLYRGVARFFPEEWRRFRDGVPACERDSDLVAAYHRLLDHADPGVREQTARDWCDWEDVVASMDPDQHDSRYDDPRFRMAFTRIVTHYFHHHAWLESGILLREARRLAGIPGVLVQGRLDLGSPPVTAWELAEAWRDARLELVGTGHGGGDEMDERLVEATDRFADPFLTPGRIATSKGNMALPGTAAPIAGAHDERVVIEPKFDRERGGSSLMGAVEWGCGFRRAASTFHKARSLPSSSTLRETWAHTRGLTWPELHSVRGPRQR